MEVTMIGGADASISGLIQPDTLGLTHPELLMMPQERLLLRLLAIRTESISQGILSEENTRFIIDFLANADTYLAPLFNFCQGKLFHPETGKVVSLLAKYYFNDRPFFETIPGENLGARWLFYAWQGHLTLPPPLDPDILRIIVPESAPLTQESVVSSFSQESFQASFGDLSCSSGTSESHLFPGAHEEPAVLEILRSIDPKISSVIDEGFVSPFSPGPFQTSPRGLSCSSSKPKSDLLPKAHQALSFLKTQEDPSLRRLRKQGSFATRNFSQSTPIKDWQQYIENINDAFACLTQITSLTLHELGELLYSLRDSPLRETIKKSRTAALLVFSYLGEQKIIQKTKKLKEALNRERRNPDAEKITTERLQAQLHHSLEAPWPLLRSAKLNRFQIVINPRQVDQIEQNATAILTYIDQLKREIEVLERLDHLTRDLKKHEESPQVLSMNVLTNIEETVLSLLKKINELQERSFSDLPFSLLPTQIEILLTMLDKILKSIRVLKTIDPIISGTYLDHGLIFQTTWTTIASNLVPHTESLTENLPTLNLLSDRLHTQYSNAFESLKSPSSKLALHIALILGKQKRTPSISMEQRYWSSPEVAFINLSLFPVEELKLHLLSLQYRENKEIDLSTIRFFSDFFQAADQQLSPLLTNYFLFNNTTGLALERLAKIKGMQQAFNESRGCRMLFYAWIAHCKYHVPPTQASSSTTNHNIGEGFISLFSQTLSALDSYDSFDSMHSYLSKLPEELETLSTLSSLKAPESYYWENFLSTIEQTLISLTTVSSLLIPELPQLLYSCREYGLESIIKNSRTASFLISAYLGHLEAQNCPEHTILPWNDPHIEGRPNFNLIINSQNIREIRMNVKTIKHYLSQFRYELAKIEQLQKLIEMISDIPTKSIDDQTLMRFHHVGVRNLQTLMATKKNYANQQLKENKQMILGKINSFLKTLQSISKHELTKLPFTPLSSELDFLKKTLQQIHRFIPIIEQKGQKQKIQNLLEEIQLKIIPSEKKFKELKDSLEILNGQLTHMYSNFSKLIGEIAHTIFRATERETPPLLPFSFPSSLVPDSLDSFLKAPSSQMISSPTRTSPSSPSNVPPFSMPLPRRTVPSPESIPPSFRRPFLSTTSAELPPGPTPSPPLPPPVFESLADRIWSPHYPPTEASSSHQKSWNLIDLKDKLEPHASKRAHIEK